MDHGKTFLLCSGGILILAVINLSVGPAINLKTELKDWPWSLQNCEIISDLLKKYIKDNENVETIKKTERKLSECRHKKPMHSLEEISFITNLAIGFICFLFASFGLEKVIKTKIGLVGMILGVIGFIITFLYVVYNGIVYTNYYDSDNFMKVDGDSAFAELDGNRYKCFYYKENGGEEALVARYSDLIKSQYNYNKGLIDAFKDENSEQSRCKGDPDKCSENGYIDAPYHYGRGCKKLFYKNRLEDYANFDKSSRFLACLILSIFSLLSHCGLVFCGFILFKEP